MLMRWPRFETLLTFRTMTSMAPMLRTCALVASLSLVTTQAIAAQAPLTAAQRRAVLLDPKRSFWATQAPAIVTADMETSRGTITLELVREWAPAGVDRFYNLARAGYFDDSRFYRVIYGFIAQFGIAGDPAVAKAWSQRTLPADPAREHNLRATIAYAQSKPTDRTTNAFINLRDNPELDTLHFVPFGRVVQGMEVVDSLYAFYGEFPAAEPPLGDPKRLFGESNKYLDAKFPKLDRIVKVTIRPN
jgi:peptidyl-prolyl cis-trans isomerase A (cyclophilin A)